MKKVDGATKALGYICVFCVFVFGMIAIVGSGGGSHDSWLYPLWVPTDIVVSDIDVNGGNDVLTIARLSTSISNHEGNLKVYNQKDQGGFWPPSTYIVGEYPWQLVVSDIDGDGLSDLLVTDPDLEDLRLLLQDPGSNGLFLPPRQIISGINAYYAAVADFNNDGTSDIAIGDPIIGSNRIVILYQDPGHQDMFLPAMDFMIPGTSSSNITAGDLDGDGLADLLAWIYLERSGWTPNGVLAISLQQPSGTLGPITTLAPQTGLNVDLLKIADYNGDGANDLFVFFTPSSADYKAKLTVILQESVPGTFAAPVDNSLADIICCIDSAAVADLNGDDRPDFVVGESFSRGTRKAITSRLYLYTQSGGGAFSLEDTYNMSIHVSSVTAGDIDNDGLNDLVILGSENQCMVMIQSHDMIGTFNSPNPL